ncbi:MAG: GNAT family N-acetyltransferase [Chloroflexi bacterium]|nr:GNAT family N-acetyltransferase [Chloroflexota bacterium]
MKDLYRGTLVRLTDEAPEALAKSLSKWNQDTEQRRLADDSPAQLWSEKKLKEYVEKRAENNPQSFRFWIRALADDALIGGVSLWVASWTHAEAWMGIFIGDRAYWGRGYGTDAVRLILQYGFLELNLRRVSLGLHAYNERARKSYEKCGFVMEGRMRGEGLRDGVHYDSLWMGILREEWLAQQGARL